MTIWQFGEVLRRQWLVCLIGALLASGFMFHLATLNGLYYEQVNVIFLPPAQVDTNALQNPTASLIGTAGVISQIVAGPDSGTTPVSQNATLVGTGVKHGYSVRLPNDGGQWANNFTQPVLDVEVVGTSEGEVTATMDKAIALINTELDKRQNGFGVDAKNRIHTRRDPVISAVSHSKGSPIRSLAAALLLCSGLTAAAAVMVDRRRRKRAAAQDVSRATGSRQPELVL
jgi:hypothetical protein